jgi:hypothetical protein
LARAGLDVSKERELLDREPSIVFDLSDLPRAIRRLQTALGNKADNPTLRCVKC